MTDDPPAGHGGDVAATHASSMPEPRPAHQPGAGYNFTEVYEDYFSFVWRTVRRLGVAERSLDDAVQDVFLVVHRRLADFEGRSSLKSWIFGIARRVAKDHRRRSDRKDRGQEFPEGGLPDPRAPSPLESATRTQARQLLYQMLESLDEDKREVFVLAELEQMSAPEIAAATSVNLNTIYSRLRAARRAFDAAVARHHAREAAEGTVTDHPENVGPNLERSRS